MSEADWLGFSTAIGAVGLALVWVCVLLVTVWKPDGKGD